MKTKTHKEITQTILIPIKNSPYEDIRIHTQKTKHLQMNLSWHLKKQLILKD